MIKSLLNYYGTKHIPILFIIDFKLDSYYIKPLNKLDNDIFFQINNKQTRAFPNNISYSYNSIKFKQYQQAFDKVQTHIKNGNSYLLNLTFSSAINISMSLKDIYKFSNAKFKLYFKDKFVCFSPERFVKISNNKIYTYPMKGTINANILNAQDKILTNKKELAEHTMIVDLLRNDLNMVSTSVKVNKFRYIEKIQTGKTELLQVSSEISGNLEHNWQNRLGDIITTLLPAGSITGTPKKKTIEIINEIEEHTRGFFTGIFGVFDGNNLDSAVMIRFIEKIDNQLYYKSGGGITIDSNVYDEYQELKDKIYVPIF